MNTDQEFYFAYGSNLNTADLLESGCGLEDGELEIVSSANLPDRDLRFTRRSLSRQCGVLDVVPCRGSAVPGMLFRVPRPETWKKLDRKEGAPHCYKRLVTTVVLPTGELRKATTYEVVEDKRTDFVAPDENYYNIVKEGLDNFDLPLVPLERARDCHYPTSAIGSLFVYGTLMRGEERSCHISAADPDCILLAEVFGKLLNCGNYPAMVGGDCREQQIVQGEFCRMSGISELLKALDEIEGFWGYEKPNNLFCRTLIDVHMGDGRIRFGWTYIWNGDAKGLAEISSGDWRVHRGVREQVLTRIAQAHSAELSEESILRRFRHRWNGSRPVDIADALARRLFSERELAQVTSKWAVGI